jgi:putative ABC transport system permease protein
MPRLPSQSLRSRWLLRVRWSWRDLRARWLQVAAIALVIGIGSGVYSGLSSTSEWRYDSYDASFERLAMWDLHIELAEDAPAPASDLIDAVSGIEDSAALDAVDPRLLLPTQVDASTDDTTILVPGRLVGVDVETGPRVARIEALEGRSLVEEDAGRDVAVLDEHFADHYDLPAEGEFHVAGATLDYVGRGLSPEYFIIIPPQGTVFGEAGFAVAWAPLDTVQRIAGTPGEINSLAITIEPGADRDLIEEQVTAALETEAPDTGFTVTRQEDHPVFRTMYEDIEGDQRFYNVFAVVILLGAAFAAFNLTGRIIQAQRREIGIGMALGASPATLAVRPVLVGVQVALLGVLFGLAVGWVIQTAMAAVLSALFPLPVWTTEFQPAVFLRGAILGLILPIAAAAVPVIGAVRVPPVEAIRTAHLTASGGLAPLLRRVPLPGSSMARLPFRNTLRAPRRALLTALGIGAAITTLVGVVGLLDSLHSTLDRAEEEALGDVPDRLNIDLEPTLVESEPVQEVLASPLLGDAEPALTLGGSLDPGGADIEVFLSVMDLDSDVWHPTIESGDPQPGDRGLVLSRKATEDLGLDVGDRVVLRHPLREGLSYRLVDTEVPVTGVHPNPLRFVAYMDLADADLFALEGTTNTLHAVPAPGVEVEEVQRTLFGQPGVVSTQPVRTQVETIRERLDEFLEIFTIVQAAVLVLALLIAFNSSSISLDERRRENATMFAFGVPVRTALRSNITESLITGLLGTVIGIAVGRLLVAWLTTSLMADTVPDIGLVSTVSSSTVLTALLLGAVAVVLAPILTVRRMRRMDIPSTLRVVE